jgi:acyl-CoA reductase-like NAD-dependent aldehyde dehydrogenase
VNVDTNEAQLKDLVESIVRQVVTQTTGSSQGSVGRDKGDWGVFDDMKDAIEAAHQAFMEFRERSIQCKRTITAAIRKLALDHKEELAQLTVDETGMGRVDHKIEKYINASKYSPGVEVLQPQAWSGRNGLGLDEFAPYGVIGNKTPSTHPGPVMINSMIIQLAGGNSATFNPHPSAKRVSAKVIKLANQYLLDAGAPLNLVTCVQEPTPETSRTMFGHDKVGLLSVTDDTLAVDLASTYPKKVIASSPGNPPVLVDETADLSLAAREITNSAGFDNNILCIAEKEIFVVDSVFETFMQKMEEVGNVRLDSNQMETLGETVLQRSDGHWLISQKHAGKSARFLGQAIGLNLSDDVPLLFGETKNQHAWVIAEQKTCCLPVVRIASFEEGLKAARLAEQGFRHTASIFTRDMNRATTFVRRMDCTVNVINGGTLRGNGGDGGEGYFSHTIATPTGEGICTPLDYVRKRRIMTHQAYRFV